MSRYCPYKEGPALYLDCEGCTEKHCNAFFCLVVGSRTFSDYILLKRKLDHILQNKKHIVIVSGGAKGADQLAEKYAKENGYFLKIFPAEWDKYGKSAGYIRNEKMHQFINNFSDRGVVAFWKDESKGTAQNFELAKKYNNQIRVIKII